ncbi:VanZ family protein [Chloroflexota bacterium]
MRRKTFLALYWLPAVAWMAVIYYFSTLPEAMTPGRYVIPDKISHAGEYCILAFFIFIALGRMTRLRFAASSGIIIGWVTIFGISDEIHQLFVPTRHFDLLDLAADVGGATFLMLILWLLQRSGGWGTKIYRLLAGKERQ